MSSPTCPYCGKDMEWARSYHSMLLPGQSVRFWWACECGASSPHRAEEDEALAAAMQRYVEPDKQINGVCAGCMWRSDSRMFCMLNGDEAKFEVLLDDWCGHWERRPTDEERESAPWEESQ